jgi:ABC-type oligopeptide transport system substrate-binding subunit
MKKYTFILALGVSLTLTACGSGSTSKETTDSTAVQVDTAAVSATDSTTAQIPADSSSVK